MSDTKISLCRPEDQRAALELVLSSVPVGQRSPLVEGLRPLAEEGVDVFSALVAAKAGGKVVGAAWLQPQVGRTATLWPSQLSHGEAPLQRAESVESTGNAPTNRNTPSSLTRDLANAALRAAGGLPVDLVQTTLESADDPFAADLLAIGFTHLADLLYLVLDVPREAHGTKVDPRLRLSSPATGDLDLLEHLLVGSYEQTQDCPALKGLRQFSDTIASYQSAWSYDESLWFVALWEDRPAGLALLTPYPDSCQWELAYMGVIPPFRGHGIGRQILADVQRRAAEEGVAQIVLAVDTANQPARKIYAAAGYFEWCRRTAWMKSLLENCEG